MADRIDLSLLRHMLHSPVRNYAIPGLTSWLIGEPSAHGTMRLFQCERDHDEPIVPHSHRFDFQCCVLKGSVRNRIWRGSAAERMMRIHEKTDGLLMIADSGQARYMTLLEHVMYRLFGRVSAISNARTDRRAKPDCDGPSPCATCQDRRECGRAGCVRQREYIGSAPPAAGVLRNSETGEGGNS